MRHFRLSSITIELILLFVATFAILEVVSLGYRSVSQAENLASLEAIRIADNIVDVTSLIEKTPPEERSAAVENFKGSDL